MSKEMRGLDNWITGHYGEDQFRNCREDIEDEGLVILYAAQEYLKPRADADEDEQLIGDFEAWCILQIAVDKIMAEYECHFCGAPISRRKDRYCSKNCYRADAEGF